ncbi:MAG: hypothetical protein JEZ11_02120 [Desulfobacterales bacterium]|nr:hypothetical protein [Desulfobacterales bacterium]
MLKNQSLRRVFTSEAYAVELKANDKSAVHSDFSRFAGLLPQLRRIEFDISNVALKNQYITQRCSDGNVKVKSMVSRNGATTAT